MLLGYHAFMRMFAGTLIVIPPRGACEINLFGIAEDDPPAAGTSAPPVSPAICRKIGGHVTPRGPASSC
jgi:hypothetical protein